MQRVEHGRNHVDDVGVVRAQLAARGDAARPGDDERIGRAAPVVSRFQRRNGVLPACVQPHGKWLNTVGPPISSMRASPSSTVSGTLLKNRTSLTDPVGPPRWNRCRRSA